MRSKKRFTISVSKKGLPIVGLMFTAVVVFCMSAWMVNIYKLTECDFAEPYKAEIIRGVGIPFAPLGVIVGYMTIEDG